MIVFLLLLWAAIGHRITARYEAAHQQANLTSACTFWLDNIYSKRAQTKLSCILALCPDAVLTFLFRLSFVGDGMTACGLGLAMGLGLLAATEYLGSESLHAMLTFNPGNFFT